MAKIVLFIILLPPPPNVKVLFIRANFEKRYNMRVKKKNY